MLFFKLRKRAHKLIGIRYYGRLGKIENIRIAVKILPSIPSEFRSKRIYQCSLTNSERFFKQSSNKSYYDKYTAKLHLFYTPKHAPPDNEVRWSILWALFARFSRFSPSVPVHHGKSPFEVVGRRTLIQLSHPVRYIPGSAQILFHSRRRSWHICRGSLQFRHSRFHPSSD